MNMKLCRLYEITIIINLSVTLILTSRMEEDYY